MAFISKEIPTGTINGVNKVFTLLNDVDYIDDVFYDGAVTADYTRVDKILTLTYAPTTSIFVDYYTASAQSVVTNDCTFLDIKNKVWLLMGAKSTSTNFSDTVVGNEINMIGRAIWKGRIINKLNPRQIFKAGKMYFKDQSYVVRIKRGGTITAEVEVGDTEILMDTTNLLGAGYIELGGDIINYTSKTTTQINGVSGITINHLVGEKATQLYETPVLIDKPTSLEKIEGGKTVFEIPNNEGYINYEIIRTNITLLKISGLEGDDLVRINYVEQFANMSLDTDNCPFPDDYGISVLAYLVAGSLGYDKGIPNSQNLLNSGYTSLQVMYGDFSNELSAMKNSLKPKFTPRQPL